jgi:type II secretory pathway component PulM
MERTNPTSEDWIAYYARADRIRSVVGDPLKRHIARITFKERLVLAGSGLFLLVAATAFGALTLR